MKFVRLAELVRFVGGGTPSRDCPEFWNGDIPWVSCKDLNTNIGLRKSLEGITEEGLRSSASNLIPAGSLLVATRMSLGKAVINEIPVAINQDLKAAVCKDSLDTRYLLWFWLSQSRILNLLGSGATVKGITLDQIGDLRIPLPPVEEQKRIAAILDKADAIRRKREQAIQLADEFLRSLFLDMFGDPILNPKGWLLEDLSNVTARITDGEHLNPLFAEDGLSMVMAGHVLESGVSFLGTRKVSLEDGERFRRKCRPELGDLLLVSRGATIGRCCVLTDSSPFCLMGSVILIKPNRERLCSQYLQALFRSPAYRGLLFKTSGSSAQQAIYLQHLGTLKVPLPPISLQEEYSDYAGKVSKTYRVFSKAVEETSSLMDSLSHRAFRGEI